MISEKGLRVLKKRYTKRVRQMSHRYETIVREAPNWVVEDVAPNFRKTIDEEHVKLNWINERLKRHASSSN